MESAVHNKPYDARNTMSAFTQKEVAVLTGGSFCELKVPPLKSFIAATVPDRCDWDAVYITAWRVLSSMRALCERNTTDKIVYYWGVPFTPRSYTDKNGQETRVHCILSSEQDEQTLVGIWKHEHSRLLTLLTNLADPKWKSVLEDFKLEEILFEPVDIHAEYKLLTWVAKDESLPIIADNAIFIRTSMGPKTDKAARAPECGNVPKPKPHFSNAKVAGSDQRSKATGAERTYSRGNTPGILQADESPYTSRKGDNAKRHDRRSKGKNKQRSKWDD